MYLCGKISKDHGDLLERSSLKAIGLRLGLDVRMVDGHLHIWLATGGLNEVQVNKFLPLRHYRVILFPDTDPEGRAYLPQRHFLIVVSLYRQKQTDLRPRVAAIFPTCTKKTSRV